MGAAREQSGGCSACDWRGLAVMCRGEGSTRPSLSFLASSAGDITAADGTTYQADVGDSRCITALSSMDNQVRRFKLWKVLEDAPAAEKCAARRPGNDRAGEELSRRVFWC